MRRDVLNQFLLAGPSRRFDVRFFTSRTQQEVPAGPRLFCSSFLNSTILFKSADRDRKTGEDVKTVATLIYLPYDEHRPGDGGESLVFSEHAFLNLCHINGAQGADGARAVEADLAKLRLLDSLPTFSPFIIELAFHRADVPIPPAYLQLTPETRNKLTAHLKSRLRPLIVAAHRRSARVIDHAVEELTAKLFSLRDMTAIMPLIEALRLRPESAQDVLTAWTGIAYFEYEYSALQPKLKEFAGWLGGSGQELARQDSDYAASLITSIRQKIRLDWNEIVEISSEYRASYDAMVFQGELEPFLQFLSHVRSCYWRMGDVLGRLEQAVLAWKHCLRGASANHTLSHLALKELLFLIRELLLISG